MGFFNRLLAAALSKQAEAGFNDAASLSCFDPRLSSGAPGAMATPAGSAWLADYGFTAIDGPPRLTLNSRGELSTGLTGPARVWSSDNPESGWQLVAPFSFTTNAAAFSRTGRIPFDQAKRFFKLTN